MIWVDRRAGSSQFVPLLIRLGVAAKLAEMEYGDMNWEGNGPRGDVRVGVEHKTVPDFLKSMRDGRLQGRQLPGMVGMYEVRYLMIQGGWRASKRGMLEIWRVSSGSGRGRWVEVEGRISYREVAAFLTGVGAEFGVTVLRTEGVEESARLLAANYLFWAKPWKEHKLAKEVYIKEMVEEEKGIMERILNREMGKRETGLKFRVAAQLEGVGQGKAREVAGRFENVREMVTGEKKKMGEKERERLVRMWTGVGGVGRKMAVRIVDGWEEI